MISGDQIGKMEVYLLIIRMLNFVILIMEMLLFASANSLGVTDIKFPPKFSYNDHLRPEGTSTGRKSRSDLLSDLHSKRHIGDDSIEQSRILDFINTIRTNSIEQASYCARSTDNVINLSHFKYTFEPPDFQTFHKQAKEAKFIASYLNDLYVQHKNFELKSLNDDYMSAIVSLLRRVLKDDPILAGGGIAFSTNFSLFPYIYRINGDLSSETNLGTKHAYKTADFYSFHSQRKINQSKYSSVSSSGSHIQEDEPYWGSPSFECAYLKRWITSISFPFHSRQGNEGTLKLKGVVILDIDLNKTSVNQCEGSTTLFSGSHKCRPETTQCQFVPDRGFAAGNYECHCKAGFYFPFLNSTQKFYSGTQVERHFLQSMRNDTNVTLDNFQCLPCQQGCIGCDDDSPCFVEYNILMRGIPLGIQSFCMTITLVLGIVILRLRKCKVMVISMWCLLEIILLGALFLYATVVIQYFEPSTTTCLTVPWLREVGFAILYGALVLKIYRLLADFQSRKAHRVHVRDKDLLKYLLCIVVVVTGYMAAWTAVNIDQVQDGMSMVKTGSTTEEDLRYFVCKAGWWDYSTEVAEVLFLVFGIYLCYRVRAAPSEYSEGTYVSAAICYECFISTVFYILRHIYWLELHPDYLFLMYFLRCQLTVTVTLILVFGPKLWYAHRPPDDRHIRNRAYSSSEGADTMAPETMKLNVGISSNGDVDIGEVSLADMDPEDIRAELKRLYTQLQIYKTRSMRKDNPHISKRRGGRKQTHRRFSLQAFHHKHRHHHDHEHEHEMSKTPEESTNSAEGLPLPIEMSVTKCDDVNEMKPTSTVSFKMCHTHK